jgi:hypothetical protein
MNRCLLFLTIFALSASSFGVESYSITLGSKETETLSFLKKQSQKKDVYVLAYHSPRNQEFTQAIPKDLYFELSKKISGIDKSLAPKTSVFARRICGDKISVQFDQDTHLLCLDSLKAEEKKAFLDWFYKNSKLAQGQP